MFENEYSNEHEDYLSTEEKINLCYTYIDNGTIHFNMDFIEDTVEDCLVEEFYDDGIELCDYILNIYPNNTEILILKGRLLNAINEFKEAEEIFISLLEVLPSNNEIYIYLAEAYLGMLEPEKAKIYLDIASEFNDDESYLFDLYGKYYKTIGNYNKAIEYFEKSMENNIYYQKNYFEIAYCYERLGDNEVAASYYSQFLEYDPFNPVAWYNYGIILNNIKKYSDAIQAYENAIGLDIEFSDAWYNKGITHLHLKNYEEALYCFNQAQLIDKYDEDVLFNLGKVHEFLNDYDKAIAAYNRILEIKPDNPEALISRAVCYLNNLKYHLCERDLLYVIENYEIKRSEAYLLLGEMYEDIGNIKKAIELYHQALIFYKEKSNISQEDIQISLINAYLKDYQVQTALKLLAKLIENNTDEAEPYYILSRIYNIIGQIDLSQFFEKQAVSLEETISEIIELDYPRKTFTNYFDTKILSN
jgi:tetratricopeptide (TPR) repeat protein